MTYEIYAHRFADIILNSDYALKQEIEEIIKGLSFGTILSEFENENQRRVGAGKRPPQGKQSTINALFRREFSARGWQVEKNVFSDPENDLAIDFWKRNVGVDIAFNHRSFIGGDLLRLQAAAEVKNVINVGVYVCPTKEFAKNVSPKDGTSIVVFERAKWYLENFYAVLTAPLLLIGLTGLGPQRVLGNPDREQQGANMLRTHGGGKAKRFDWVFRDSHVVIENEKGRHEEYALSEVLAIINWLMDRFGLGWFPLGNNVAKLGRGEEVDGLGVAILQQQPKNLSHAQGASYLGVVLDHVGILEWKHVQQGIKWRIIRQPASLEELKAILDKKTA